MNGTDDPTYRYVMPPIQSTQHGKGNKKKTGIS
jgi:hypothetical protein